jgi:glycosyltransferase involved in cell wall biosynthesis
MKRVSVIIPIYNVEKYLGRCLDSVLKQTHENIEFICINDKSSDNSGQILAEYAKKCDRFKIVNHEKNKGLSGARNSGMRTASGEYIYFLDSDDYIDDDYIENMVSALEKDDSDMVLNLNIVSENGGKSTPYIHPTFKEVAPHGEFIIREKAIHNLPWNVWPRLYKKSFFDKYNIRFPKGYVIEDLYFHYITHVYVDSEYVFTGSRYHYTSRVGSISKKDPNLDLFVMKIYNIIYDYFLQNRLLNKYEIKMFQVFPYFSVNTEEKFDIYRMYFKKINAHLELKKYLYNKMELFFADNILNSKSFEKYINNFNTNVALSFIKSNNKIMSDGQINC